MTILRSFVLTLALPIPSSLGLIPLIFDLLWSYVIVSNRTKHVKDRCNALLVSGFTLLCVRSWFGCLSLSAMHPTKNLAAYLNPQPSILNTQPSTLNTQHSTRLIVPHHPHIANGSEWCIALLIGWWMVVLIPFRVCVDPEVQCTLL